MKEHPMPQPSGPGWTDERIEILKHDWAEGLSASQIAGKLGEVTRNAVIGKVHRLGLPGRATTSRLQASYARMNQRRRANLRIVKPVTITVRPKPRPAPPSLTISDMLMIELLALTAQTCKYPIGDPQDNQFGFCGRSPITGETYCEFHYIVCHQIKKGSRY
jgi:GcrA cell cycle regulator